MIAYHSEHGDEYRRGDRVGIVGIENYFGRLGTVIDVTRIFNGVTIDRYAVKLDRTGDLLSVRADNLRHIGKGLKE